MGYDGETRIHDTLRCTRRRALKGVIGTLGVTAFQGSASAAVGTADRPVASEPSWARVISIHPRWYWDAETVEESRQAMHDWLDLAMVAGVNVLHAWIESPEAAAILGEPRYASADRYDFWNSQRWDALDELITQAERRGIEVHLWYSFTRYKWGHDRSPEYDPDLSVLPPGDPSWASIRKSEFERGLTDPRDRALDAGALCNNAYAAHDWTLTLLTRLFEQYPRLQGLKIEEPGYLALDRCVCPRCQNTFAEIYGGDGEDLLSHVYNTEDPYYDDDAAVPVKVRGTNRFVHRLKDWWESSNYGHALTFTSNWKSEPDRIRGRNWAVWDREGLVPYFTPQTFSRSLTTFQWRLRTAMGEVQNADLIPSVGISFGWGENDPSEVTAQIEHAYAHDGHAGTPVEGATLFSGAALTQALARRLRTEVYTAPAVPPWDHGGTGVQQARDPGAVAVDELQPFTWNHHWGNSLPGAQAVTT